MLKHDNVKLAHLNATKFIYWVKNCIVINDSKALHVHVRDQVDAMTCCDINSVYCNKHTIQERG